MRTDLCGRKAEYPTNWPGLVESFARILPYKPLPEADLTGANEPTGLSLKALQELSEKLNKKRTGRAN